MQQGMIGNLLVAKSPPVANLEYAKGGRSQGDGSPPLGPGAGGRAQVGGLGPEAEAYLLMNA